MCFPKSPLLVLLLFWLAVESSAGGMDALISQLHMRPVSQRQAAVDSFIQHLPQGRAPVCEDSTAWFLYSGRGSGLQVAGDMSDWLPGINMHQLYGSNLWYCRFDCQPDARLDYKLVRNGGDWFLDPLNPQRIEGGYGANSELIMPDYPDHPEILDHGYPPPQIVNHENFYSPQLENSRLLSVLLPPAYSDSVSHDVLVIQDGLDFINLGRLANVLAWLAEKYPDMRLPICACLPAIERKPEYEGVLQEKYGRFIQETLRPFLMEHYSTYGDDPAHWGSLGSSNGGNVSLYLARRYPGSFHKLAVMSPYIPVEQREGVLAQPPGTYRIYLNYGRYDLGPLQEPIRQFLEQAQAAGHEVDAHLYNEGHSWGLWRATLAEALLYLYQD